jgi:hypothetical protein
MKSTIEAIFQSHYFIQGDDKWQLGFVEDGAGIEHVGHESDRI